MTTTEINYDFDEIIQLIETLKEDNDELTLAREEQIELAKEIKKKANELCNIYTTLQKQEFNKPEHCEYCDITVKNMDLHRQSKKHQKNRPEDAHLLKPKVKKVEKPGYKLIKKLKKETDDVYNNSELSNNTTILEAMNALDNTKRELEKCLS